MVVEATILLALTAFVFTLAGLWIVLLIGPELGGRQLLMAPAVGLCTLYLACQWLSPFLSSTAVIAIVLAVSGALTFLVAGLRRSLISSWWKQSRLDVLIAGAGGLTIYLVLLIHSFSIRLFTITSQPISDGLFFYAPTAELVGRHPYGVVAGPKLHTPFLEVLHYFGTKLYQGSMGTLEGGLSGLAHRPVYAVLEPLNAACIAIALVGAYVLAVGAMRLSRTTGAMALALMATNQFYIWSFAQEHVQEMRAAVLLPAALVFFVCAMRERHLGSAVLLGAIASALTAIYLPMFVLLVAMMAAGTVAAMASARFGGRRDWWPTIPIIALASALVIGLPNLVWLLPGHGLAEWQGTAQFVLPPSDYHSIPLHLAHLMSVAPIADLYRLAPPLFWSPSWGTTAHAIAYLSVALTLLGLITLLARKQWIVASLFLGAAVYIIYVWLGTPNQYGRTKTAEYLVPLVSILMAAGLVQLGERIRKRTSQTQGDPPPHAAHGPHTGHRAPTLMAFAVILGAQVAATTETANMYLQIGPSLSQSDLAMRSLPDLVAANSRILLYDAGPTIPGTELTANSRLMTEAAYFLIDRDVTVTRDPYLDFGLVDRTRYTPLQCGPLPPEIGRTFEYVLMATTCPPALKVNRPFRLRWSSPTSDLLLYQRVT